MFWPKLILGKVKKTTSKKEIEGINLISLKPALRIEYQKLIQQQQGNFPW